MKARDQLRAGKNFKLREDDAGAKPLRGNGNNSSNGSNNSDSKSGIKQDERDLTLQLTDRIAVLQEMLYARRQRKEIGRAHV